MNFNQNKVSEGLDKLPYGKMFNVPDGSLPFIENFMRAFDYDGGIQLNSDKSKIYKIRLPELKKV